MLGTRAQDIEYSACVCGSACLLQSIHDKLNTLVLRQLMWYCKTSKVVLKHHMVN